MSPIEEMMAILFGAQSEEDRAAMTLSGHRFKAPNPDQQQAMMNAMSEVCRNGFDKIDSLFVVAVVKNPPDHSCEGCGGSHPEGVQLLTAAAGNLEVIRAGLVLSIDAVARKVGGEPETIEL